MMKKKETEIYYDLKTFGVCVLLFLLQDIITIAMVFSRSSPAPDYIVQFCTRFSCTRVTLCVCLCAIAICFCLPTLALHGNHIGKYHELTANMQHPFQIKANNDDKSCNLSLRTIQLRK